MQVPNTSLERTLAALSPKFLGHFRQLSITGKHQMGWVQAILQKALDFGFLSGLSSWKQSGQKALCSQPSFTASRATDGFPKHLKSALLPCME